MITLLSGATAAVAKTNDITISALPLGCGFVIGRVLEVGSNSATWEYLGHAPDMTSALSCARKHVTAAGIDVWVSERQVSIGTRPRWPVHSVHSP